MQLESCLLSQGMGLVCSSSSAGPQLALLALGSREGCLRCVQLGSEAALPGLGLCLLGCAPASQLCRSLLGLLPGAQPGIERLASQCNQ